METNYKDNAKQIISMDGNLQEFLYCALVLVHLSMQALANVAYYYFDFEKKIAVVV